MTLTRDGRTYSAVCDGCATETRLELPVKASDETLDQAISNAGLERHGSLDYCARCAAVRAEDPIVQAGGRSLLLSELILQATEGPKEARGPLLDALQGEDAQAALDRAKKAQKGQQIAAFDSRTFHMERPPEGSPERAAYDRRHHVRRMLDAAAAVAGKE